MAKQKHSVDKPRASRDGHEYHEIWTARKAMQLLWPDSKLTAIAVEGLSPSDQEGALAETVDIADITLYYDHPTFEGASHTTVSQFKYSISDRDVDFRASHAKKTVAKFAETYCDYKKRYGSKAVHEKLSFELITNRPIYKPLLQAIEALAQGLPRTGEIEKQAQQFKKASGLDGKSLSEFAAKCKFSGLSGSLPATKSDLAGMIVDWSANRDPLASARLGQLKQMVRDKAGYAGTDKNLITRTDILASFDIGDEEDLLPCKTAITDVGEVVNREQLADAIALISGLSKPLLIHASGGVGKTVFMNCLATSQSNHNEVVFFDCFGGGAYRSPEDARHLPNKGLIHIANALAFRSLCDPILPGANDVQSLLKTFRRRLIQCVDTLKRAASRRGLVIFIDAIDNAELFARERSEESFPVLLLEIFHHDPIPGVKFIVSCRTERKPSTHAQYQEFMLRPFSINETADYLRPRLKNVSQAEINVAQARSGGNPRVLEYLVKSGRSLFDDSEIDKKVDLDDLIQERISDALAAARKHGYKQEDINSFLAGLAVLPPPVPISEYADAQGMVQSAIESFVADLRPLLERTNQGIMFRDEPTETFVRNRYASSQDALHRVAKNLLTRQNLSVYAARALPGLLFNLNDGEQLFQLAFDDRIPEQITSTVGKRNIRYARIKAAVLYAAMKRDYNQLVQLLIELSTIAAVNQRGANYILDYPDLVVAAQDVDAMRRLFETRTGWPGARHARLTIAYSLSGLSEEAYRHANATDEWIKHYRRTYREDSRDRAHPEKPDIAALPFFFICEGRSKDALRFLKGWKDWYSYEVCEYVYDYFRLAASIRQIAPSKLTKFTSALTGIGPLAAVLSFQELPKSTRKDLITRLARVCKKPTNLDLPKTYHRNQAYELQDGLRKASALALSLGMIDEALILSLRATHERPGIWSLRDNFYNDDVFPFLFRTALIAAAKGRALHEKDVLPKELVPICSRIKKDLMGKDFRDKVIKILPKYVRKKRDGNEENDSKALSHDMKDEAERFIKQRLESLLDLTNALAGFLTASPQRVDNAFIELLKAWENARINRNPYQTGKFNNLFPMLGFETVFFALWTRSELKPDSVSKFLKTIHDQSIGAHTLIRIVSLFAQRETLKVFAGEQALKARTLIEAEDDVTYQASLFAKLGQAMLPACTDDASLYFREGLEQMDAIGSGDYEFTNELLVFSSSLKGDELDERDFHTLTNICELNLGEEPDKFPWAAFAGGLSKAGGLRILAKLSRWDDRSKIPLSNTLLPYLTELVDDGKIEPEIALALNRLANPVEYFESGTKEFAMAIQSKGGTSKPEIIRELIKQFEDDNPSVSMSSTVEILASLAEKTFGKSSETTIYLSSAHKAFAKIRDTNNDHWNYRGREEDRLRMRANEQSSDKREKLKSIVKATDPTDQVSLSEAIKALNNLEHIWDLKSDFFASLRRKVPFQARLQYVRNIFAMEHFPFYWKLEELKDCKNSWKHASAALDEIYKTEAISLIQLHGDEFLNNERLSSYSIRSNLKEISNVTGVPIAELSLELIKWFASSHNSFPGTFWLVFASFICPEADDGHGQIALKRLLGSEAAKLADNVVDGIWKKGFYPKDDVREIAAGLVWRMLGSPYAEDRWRAAHSMRCFARFRRCDIIDALVDMLNEKTAEPFQASELPFYYLHARLWLLIAIARMALDHPKEIARYENVLLGIVNNEIHVLMRHFAARALIACIDAGELKIMANIEKKLRTVDLSPYPRLKEKIREGGGFYEGRPDSAPKPKSDFSLDYDFHKVDVDNLSRVFGKSCWEVEDMISENVYKLDPNVSSMYDQGERKSRFRHTYEMSTRYHNYGQQLGWHALFLAAGKLLKSYPVTQDWWYDEDPWGEWLNRYLLTRNDGLWLSDGTDRTPLDTLYPFLEKGRDRLVITGDQDKLLQLVGITSRIGKELVVKGSWYSSDDIEVRISSALVSPKQAPRMARKLIREEPMHAWIPIYYQNEDDPDYLRGKNKEYTPWIVSLSGDGQLDKHDPFGVSCANSRPRLASKYASTLKLTTTEPFGRYWKNNRDAIAVRAQAWGRDSYNEEKFHSGLKLYCSAASLKKILSKYNKDLLLLISLQRYEEKRYMGDSKFTHTIAVLRISKTLDHEYFPGRINYLHKSQF